MKLYNGHTLSHPQAVFMAQFRELCSERRPTDHGVRLRDICSRYQYFNMKDCNQQCRRKRQQDESLQCPVFSIFSQVKRMKLVGVNKSPGLYIPHTQSDQSLNLDDGGLEVMKADNLPSPILIQPRDNQRPE